MAEERIVAVGLLTQQDLERLGRGFERAYPVREDDEQFTDLMQRLEEIAWKPD